jgi:hypothetical protein
MPLLAQFDKGKSIIRYFPPKLTAGFAIFFVKVSRRVPLPPASNMATNSFSKESHLFFIILARTEQPFAVIIK